MTTTASTQESTMIITAVQLQAGDKIHTDGGTTLDVVTRAVKMGGSGRVQFALSAPGRANWMGRLPATKAVRITRAA